MNKIVFSLIALAGAGTAHADAPAWCKVDGISSLGSTDYRLLASEDQPRAAFRELVGMICQQPPEIRQHAQEVEATRAAWVKRLVLTDAEWADAAQWAVESSHSGSLSFRVDRQRAWTSLDAFEQYWKLVDSGSRNRGEDVDYVADALGAKLTETGRLGYITNCVGYDQSVAKSAVCAPDIAAFDPHKVVAELRVDRTHNAVQRFEVRFRMFELGRDIARHAAEVKQAIAKDSGYAKMFALADATHAAWANRWSAKTDLLALALAMDDARVTNSRRAFAGCPDRAWPAWKAAVSAIPAKQFTDMRDPDYEHGTDVTRLAAKVLDAIIADPDAYLAAIALYTCETGDHRTGLVRQLGDALQRWPGFRGPRSATIVAILGGGIELDDRNAKLSVPTVNREWFEDSRGGSNNFGIVKSVKRNGDSATIEFATKTTKVEECVAWHHTNRVVQIRGDGTLVYQEVCDKYGMVKHDKTPEPSTVRARYVDGLKPGMYASLEEDAVTAAWAKPNDKVPAIVFGAPVK